MLMSTPTASKSHSKNYAKKPWQEFVDFCLAARVNPDTLIMESGYSRTNTNKWRDSGLVPQHLWYAAKCRAELQKERDKSDPASSTALLLLSVPRSSIPHVNSLIENFRHCCTIADKVCFFMCHVT